MKYLRPWIMLLLLAAAPIMADETEPVRGGEVIVNGRVLSGHKFYRKGGTMFFPLSVISSTLGRRVTYDLTGQNLSFAGHVFNFPDAFKIDEFVYVSWADLTHMMPDLRLSANKGRVLIEAGVFASAPHWYEKGPDAKPSEEPSPEVAVDKNKSVAVTAISNHLDAAGQLVIEAHVENHGTIPVHGVATTFELTDDSGVSTHQTFPPVQQTIGTLAPGASQTVTFQTGLVNPKTIDGDAHKVHVEEAGGGYAPVEADLTYKVTVKWDEQ